MSHHTIPFRRRTAESVTAGHPDKVCDQVSDAVLDAVLAEDPHGRVAVEVLATNGLVVVSGEVSTTADIDVEGIVRQTICGIGYDRPSVGFDGHTCDVVVAIDQQSGDIGRGVDRGGAGDQGVMIGYATDETAELIPLPQLLAHRLAEGLDELRRSGRLPYLRPDGKTQVTVEHGPDDDPLVTEVLISAQHEPDVDPVLEAGEIRTELVKRVIPAGLLAPDWELRFNPTGRFVAGGPAADTGLTGRKLVVDTYGPTVPHGGGAFSGKDPTKVDRSGAYAARRTACLVVRNGWAARCLVQVAYRIGVAEPVAVEIDTFGTHTIDPHEIRQALVALIDFTPTGIISWLDLRRPCYQETATYGHFGRPGMFSWEAAA